MRYEQSFFWFEEVSELSVWYRYCFTYSLEYRFLFDTKCLVVVTLNNFAESSRIHYSSAYLDFSHDSTLERVPVAISDALFYTAMGRPLHVCQSSFGRNVLTVSSDLHGGTSGRYWYRRLTTLFLLCPPIVVVNNQSVLVVRKPNRIIFLLLLLR